MMGKQPKTQITRLNSIQLQSSSYGLPLALLYGTNRCTGNLIWYGNFKSIPHTQKAAGGKGLFSPSSKTTDYTYTAAVMIALGEGAISGIGSVWKGKDLSSLSALGLTLIQGISGQAVWSFLSSYNTSGNWPQDVAFGYAAQNPSYTNQQLGYDTTALLVAPAYDLGSDATIPNHGFEYIGKEISAAGSGKDCNPRDVVVDFLANPTYGVGFQITWLDYDGSHYFPIFSTYCLATGILISPAMVDARAASQHLSEILAACNTDPLWSDGLLKLLPRGDTAITGNGVTFTPDLTPIYDLTDNDFGEDIEGPVHVTRKRPADAFNQIRIEFCNRANQYAVDVVGDPDQNAVELYGLRQAPVTAMHFITEATVAKLVSQTLVQRSVYIRNEYDFPLTERYALLEPGDYVTLTDPAIQMSRVLVRLTSIEESDAGYTCKAEDVPVGVAAAALYPHDNGLRFLQDFNGPPLAVAAPFIFELPADPSSTGLSIGIAVGRQSSDLRYGGCHVWASADGTNYQMVGTIHGSSRYGTLTATISPSGTPLSVHLTSGGQLPSVTSGEAAQGATMIAVDEEYLDYTTATLTGTDAYNLTGLNRGFYDTIPATHSSGTKFARVDDAICRLENLDLTLIGQTLHFKFTAFNAYQGGEQDLAAATAYSYAVTGYMEILGQKAALAKIGQDSWLTPDEKLTVILDYAILTNEKPTLDAQAAAVGADATDYDGKYAALTTYLGTISPAWNNTSVASPIVRADWDTAWNDFEDARRALVILIKSVGQVTIYIRQYAPPATPTGDNPSGWSTSVGGGTESVWQSTGNRAGSGSILGVWSTPQLASQGAVRDYSGSETYWLGNLVRFGSGTYVALHDNFSGQAPTGTSLANTYWGVQAGPGDPGTPASPPTGFTATIDLTTTTGTANLRALANTAGYPGGDATITFRVPNGVTVRGLGGSASDGGVAIDTGTWPAGYTIALTLTVQSGGIVDGGGGAGGDAGYGTGFNGGDAILVRVNMTGGITINSGGTVRAGGAGGGAGADVNDTPPLQPINVGDPICGGGGGGGGAPNGAGGFGSPADFSGSNGSAGTTSGGGAGGPGGSGTYRSGGAGGNGGTFAVNGGAGDGGGGTAGYAVRKNGFTVTVTNNGTMTGTAA